MTRLLAEHRNTAETPEIAVEPYPFRVVHGYAAS
jgi:hypothetical protein